MHRKSTLGDCLLGLLLFQCDFFKYSILSYKKDIWWEKVIAIDLFLCDTSLEILERTDIEVNFSNNANVSEATQSYSVETISKESNKNSHSDLKVQWWFYCAMSKFNRIDATVTFAALHCSLSVSTLYCVDAR